MTHFFFQLPPSLFRILRSTRPVEASSLHFDFWAQGSQYHRPSFRVDLDHKFKEVSFKLGKPGPVQFSSLPSFHTPILTIRSPTLATSYHGFLSTPPSLN